MKKRTKPLIFFTLAGVFAILGIFLLYGIVQAEEESFRTKKIVSVVYDDSGSMSYSTGNSDSGKNWAYANYAMQAYIALLNQDDEIYITYMSSPNQTEALTDFKTDRQGTVNKIRDHFDAGETPYSAVENGFNALTTHQSNESNVEYWLVIITDGEFAGNSGEQVSVNRLNDDITRYSSTVMNNGSTPKVTFFGIGDYAVCPSTSVNCAVYRANGKNLMSTLLDIADLTSGRYQYDASQIAQVESNVLEIYSKVPALSIGLMSQGANISVESVSGSDGIKIDTGENISIKAPEQYGYESDSSLFGNAVIIGNSGTNIPAGTIRITFSDSVDLDKLRIMYEPALMLKLSVTRQGKEISDYSNLRDGDKIDLKAYICEMGTENAINPDALPAGVKYGLYYQVAGQQQQSSQMELTDFEIKQGEVTIGAAASLDGVFNIKKEVSFSAKAAVVYGLQIKKTSGIDHLSVQDLGDEKEEIAFVLTADGKELIYNEVKDLPFELSVSKDIPYELVLNTQNGYYYFKPKYKWPMLSISTGEVTVTAKTIDGIEASTTFELVKAPWYRLVGDLLIWPLLILAVLALLFGYIRRKRFRRNAYIVYGIFKPSVDGLYLDSIVSGDGLEEEKLRSFSLRSLLPFSDKKKIDGLTFLPSGNDGCVLVKTSEDEIKDWHKSNRRRFEKRINKYRINMPNAGKLQMDEKDKTYSLIEGSALVIPVQGNQKSVYFYEIR